MGDARLRDAHLRDDLWEKRAYEMAPVRGTAMRWPMRDARAWETPMGWPL
jgi:hypothetical protein